MPRPTIADLAPVASADGGTSYDAEPYIETAEAAAEEDQRRARLVSQTRVEFPEAISSGACHQLLCRLIAPERYNRELLSHASARAMRDWRIAGISQSWRLSVQSGLDRCRAFTLISPRWIMSPDELADVTARQLTEQVRGWLNRRGAARSDGWLLAKLDGEFDTHNRLYRLHLHGVASGGTLDVLEALRTSPALRPQLTPMIKGRRVKRPLQISRLPLTNLPMPLSYMLKGHHTARWLGRTPAGVVKRGNRVLRIPEPWGTQVLLWLNNQPFADFFVMINLAVRDGQLVVRT